MKEKTFSKRFFTNREKFDFLYEYLNEPYYPETKDDELCPTEDIYVEYNDGTYEWVSSKNINN